MRAPNKDEVAVMFDMSPERKKTFSEVCEKIVDLFKANDISPLEAHALLGKLRESLEETYSIRSSELVDNITDKLQ